MRELPEQRRFPSIGKSDQSGIRDAAQFEIEHRLLAGRSQRVLDRGTVRRRFEIPISIARFAAFAEDEFLTDFGEVRDGFEVDPLAAALELHGLLDGHRVAAIDHSAWGHFPDDAFATFPGFTATCTIFPILRDELGVVVIGAQIVGGGVHHEDDVAASPAVAAIGSAARYKFFPAP